MNVWRISAVDSAANTYCFRLLLRAGAAGQVRIERAGVQDDPIVVPGPIDWDGTFDQALDDGQYSISWHWMVNEPDERATASFELPLVDDPTFLDVPEDDTTRT